MTTLLMKRARRIHKWNVAKKRRFLVGAQENVEAISSFQHLREAQQRNWRRAPGIESGIAFDAEHDRFLDG